MNQSALASQDSISSDQTEPFPSSQYYLTGGYMGISNSTWIQCEGMGCVHTHVQTQERHFTEEKQILDTTCVAQYATDA